MSLSIFNQSSTKIAGTLSKLAGQLAISNERLVTGKKINRASDNPSGIIALNLMRSSMAELDAKTSNAQRINSLYSTADGGLSEMSDLLNEIESNLISAADDGATAEEKAGYQANIDQAIQAIDSLVNSTRFNGKGLLDGSMAYDTSGVDASIISDVRVNRSSGGTVTLNVETTEALEAELSTNGYNAPLAGEVQMTITGPDGSYDFTFAAGTDRATLAGLVAAQSGTTGVTATDTGSEVVFSTVEAGDLTMEIEITSGGGFISVGTGTASESATGTATEVTVNGQQAEIDANYQVYFNSGGASGSFAITSTAYGAANSTSFTLSGDGGNLSMGLGSNDSIDFGLNSLNSSHLGTAKLGYLSSLRSGGGNDIASGNLITAQDIVSNASSKVSFARGRIGSIQAYSVDSMVNAMSASKEALSDSIEAIEGLDYALETAHNNRLQIMIEVGVALFETVNANLSSSMQSLLKL